MKGFLVAGFLLIATSATAQDAATQAAVDKAVAAALAKTTAAQVAEQQENEYALRFLQAAQTVAAACKKAGGKRVASTMVFQPQADGSVQAILGVTCEYDVKDLTRRRKR